MKKSLLLVFLLGLAALGGCINQAEIDDATDVAQSADA